MHFIILFPHDRTLKRNRCRPCLNTRFIPSVEFVRINNVPSQYWLSLQKFRSAHKTWSISIKGSRSIQNTYCTPLRDLLQWTLHWPYVTIVLIIYTIIYTIISLRPNTVWIYYVQSNSWLNVLIHYIQSRNSLALAEYCSPFSPQNYFKHSHQALSTKENGREVMSC